MPDEFTRVEIINEIKKPREHVQLDNEMVKTVQHYIRMVGIGDLLGCTLIGEPGQGKTHLVKQTLDEMGVKYIVYGGHITLMGIFEFLYENSDKLIFFDDVSQVINKTEIMEMLKQALNVGNDARFLNYRSNTALSPGTPPFFEFTGRIIFAFNKMDTKNVNVKAILDRAPVIELNYSYKDIIEIFHKIACSHVGGIPVNDKKMVVDYIEQEVSSDMDLSLRKLFLAFKIYKSFNKLYGKDNRDWKVQVKKLFGLKKEVWIRKFVRKLVGNCKIKRTKLAKEIAIRRDMSLRNAQRKISEALEVEQIYQNKKKGGNISLSPPF